MRLPPEPNYPGHPDDWTDEQWAEYLAWRDAVQAEETRVTELALGIAARYAAWAARIEARRPNWLSRYFRRRQQKYLDIATEYDEETP